MEPLLKNTPSNKCPGATSSNCVSYEGNTISCIPTCNNDTVSDMIYKLGQQLCYNNAQTTVVGLDMSCFYTPCPSCQQPTMIKDVLQLIINQMCAQQAKIVALQNTVDKLTGGVNPINPGFPGP